MPGSLQRLVAEMVGSGATTAVEAIVGDAKGIQRQARSGWRDPGGQGPLGRWDRFDLASLTKPWIATLALVLDRRGIVPLGLTIGEVWPEAKEPTRGRTLEALLRHRSGLIAWRPLFRQVRRPEKVVERVLRVDSAGASVPTYSDLGYILWARSAERLSGATLMDLLQWHVLRPLRVSTVGLTPSPIKAVACLLGNDREVELARALGVRVALRHGPPAGTVQDGNARHLGALPGHAGLFATARSLWWLGAEWLEPRRILTADAVDQALAGPGRYRLGWWRRAAAPRASSPLSPDSFGHNGFTGGSLWVDPDRRKVAVLMAHRAEVASDLDPWRRRFHALAVG